MSSPDDKPARSSPSFRPLYHLIALLLVAFVMNDQFPQRVNAIADGFGQRIERVDPLFLVKQFQSKYAELDAIRIREIAEYGGPPAMHGSKLGIVLEASFHALRQSIATDRWTMILTLLSLVLATLLCVKLEFWAGPFTPLVIGVLGAGIAYVLRLSSLFLADQLGTNGQLFLLVTTVWPVVSAVLTIRDTTSSIERFVERARAA